MSKILTIELLERLKTNFKEEEFCIEQYCRLTNDLQRQYCVIGKAAQLANCTAYRMRAAFDRLSLLFKREDITKINDFGGYEEVMRELGIYVELLKAALRADERVGR